MVQNNQLRLFGTANDSIVDGPGIRYVVFTQGCGHNCKGCHNPGSHDMQGGYLKDIDEILQEIDDNPLLDGVTLSGGEPILQAKNLIPLCKEIKKRNLHIVIYSGFTYEEILALGNTQKELLSLCDMLIDGKFEVDKRSLSLLYRGSSNQRIINVQESLKNNQTITYQIDENGEIID
ncbi:MAG: anaerobic ribonucleoside-triphosphate reductase activating protein [Coprobacillaceae bacterium]